ncbi:RNA-binding signal recognition particle subunit srp14, partial [Mortierella sp. GBA30]
FKVQSFAVTDNTGTKATYDVRTDEEFTIIVACRCNYYAHICDSKGFQGADKAEQRRIAREKEKEQEIQDLEADLKGMVSEIVTAASSTKRKCTLEYFQTTVAGFLTKMAKAFEDSRTSNSVYLTMKRHDYSTKKIRAADQEKNMDVDEQNKEYPTLIRLQAGTKTKYSTLVQPQDLDRFMVQYTNIIKISMDALKRKERKKAVKTKAKKATA